MNRQNFTNKSITVVSKKAPDNTAGGMQLLVPHSKRIQAIIQNFGAVDAFIYPDNTITTGTGFSVKAGTQFVDNFSSGAWFGITAGAAADLRIIECYEA